MAVATADSYGCSCQCSYGHSATRLAHLSVPQAVAAIKYHGLYADSTPLSCLCHTPAAPPATPATPARAACGRHSASSLVCTKWCHTSLCWQKKRRLLSGTSGFPNTEGLPNTSETVRQLAPTGGQVQDNRGVAIGRVRPTVSPKSLLSPSEFF